MAENDNRSSQLTVELRTDWKKDTFQQRRDRLKRRLRQISTVGIALAGFAVGLAAGDAASSMYGEVSSWMRGVVFTFVVLGGGFLGAAYIRYEEEVNFISDVIEHRMVDPTDRIGERWPRWADRFWLLALISIVLAPAAFLAGASWTVID